MSVATRLGSMPAPVRMAARAGLMASTTVHRLGHPRSLRCGDDTVVLGWLSIAGGTRVVLGDRVRVRGRVRIAGGGTLVVGADTLLNGCWITATTEVRIGERCLVSDCGITDSDHHNLDPCLRHDPPQPASRRMVELGDNVWVGAHALVLKGARIGADSVVGAGAVVRGSVPDGVVVAGNPAEIVKRFRSA
ncbi:MAG: acyltransferase [Nocardiaceae bacterium]|nr:acyltransferase [Nocardiaceae bacterium]